MAEPNGHQHQTKADGCFRLFSLLCMLVAFSCLALPAKAGAPGYSDPGYEYGVGWDPDSGAVTNTVTTSGVSDLEINTTFQCNADGSTSGILFVNPQCNADRGLFGVFANVICRVENVFGTILGLVYCAVQNAILEPLLALLTLYVTIYGAMVLLGMVPHTFNQAITRILKIGAVAAIALNAEVAIGVGYTFFISLTQTTVSIVFELFTPEYMTTDTVAANMIEAGYLSSPTNPDESRRLYLGDNWMQNLDYATHRIIGFFMQGGLGFAIVMAILFFLAPPLFLMIVYLIFSILKSFATAIVGYLLALLGITVLFTVSPIFFSFALFRVTSGWFDAWLRNLFSYTLQIMVVFVFLMIVVMIDIVSFFQQVGQMIRSYEYVFQFGWIAIPFTIFTLCRPERTGEFGLSGDLLYYKFTIDGTQGEEPGTRYEGFPRCIEDYELEEVLTGGRMPPNLTAEQRDEIISAMDSVKAGDVEIPNTDTEALPGGLETVNQIVQKANEDLKIPITELVATSDIIYFLVVRFLVLIVLTFLLERFMRKVPHMASQLAGTGFAGRLGGGEQGAGEAAGVQSGADFGGVDTGYARFKKTAYGDGYYPRNFIATGPSRFARGVFAGVSGAGQSMVRSSLQRGSSLGLSADVRREIAEDQTILESKREGLFAPMGRGGIGRPDSTYHPGGRTGRALPSVAKGRRRSRRGT